jgi:uncharacterized membrane protein
MNIRIVICLLLFMFLDFTYVYYVSSKYSVMISNIQQNAFQIHIASAILSYIVLLLILVYVVFPYAELRKHTDSSVIKTAFFAGFLIGFAIYGVFNTTNVALFKNYSKGLALLDVIWGSSLFFIVTFLFLSPSKLLIL